ncbi:MAG TPA: hypothetical protein VGN31_21600 [Paraburkholderia sp.]|jgi:hypothetical protein
MKTTLFAALLAASAALATVAAPAFASNYGPAPFYRPSVSDARPVPQAAQGAAEPAMTTAANDADAANNAQQSYGGVSDGSSQADARRSLTPWQRGLFAHH